MTVCSECGHNESWREGVRPEVADAIERLLRETGYLMRQDWPKDLHGVADAIYALAISYLCERRSEAS